MPDSNSIVLAYTNYMNDLKQKSEENHSSKETEFIIDQCQFLQEQDVLQSFQIIRYRNDEYKIQVDAWGLLAENNEDEISVALIISDFRDSDTIESQTITDFRKFLVSAKRFCSYSVKDDFRLTVLQPNTFEAELSDFFSQNRNSIAKVTVIGITNTIITSRSNTLVITENTSNAVTFYYDIWDCNRYFRIVESKTGREEVNISFSKDYGLEHGIPILKAAGNCPEIKSFLFVLPGKTLAEMYEQWNERLLEKNPRTFLQFSGKVNKGIRNTLNNEPEKFFSYNNGIAAVANNVTLSMTTGNLMGVSNFQIVNGGQTTASIYNVYTQWKKKFQGQQELLEDKISRISVMVKLSVIQNLDSAEDIIPKISEYSNTQNKVNYSAFSVWHPYHKALEDYSRSEMTPPQIGCMETHWYYERVQGQYKNAIKLLQVKRDNAGLRVFESVNPKSQVIKKEDLAKYILTFDVRPQDVCLGAQKCYALFCDTYLSENTIGAEINKEYFKECCVKALLFRALEKRVGMGIRFVLVPYTLAVVTKQLKDSHLFWNYQEIWKRQWDNEILFSFLERDSKKIMDVINKSKPETVSLLSEWGKKQYCLDAFDGFQLDVLPYKQFCLDEESFKESVKTGKETGETDQGIRLQKYIESKGQKYWNDLYNWCYLNKWDQTMLSTIKTATNWKRSFPDAWQAEKIIKFEEVAKDQGFFAK